MAIEGRCGVGRVFGAEDFELTGWEGGRGGCGVDVGEAGNGGLDVFDDCLTIDVRFGARKVGIIHWYSWRFGQVWSRRDDSIRARYTPSRSDDSIRDRYTPSRPCSCGLEPPRWWRRHGRRLGRLAGLAFRQV